MTTMDKIGQMVQSRTAQFGLTRSELTERGLSDAAHLESDPELLRQIEKLRDAVEWPDRIRAWESVREMGPTVSGWKKALQELIYQGDGWGRIFAAESLAWHRCCEDDAVPVLLVALSSTLELEHYDWSRLACGAIGRFGKLPRPLIAQTVPAMLEALDADDGNVQGYAAQALGNWGEFSRPALVKIADLHDDATEPLRAHYLEVLKKIDPTISSTQDARVRALDDQDGVVRATAVASMARNGTEEEAILPHLFSLFRDDSSEVRRNLALALGDLQVDGEEARSRLRQLTEDEDPAVRLAAAYAFVRLAAEPELHLKHLRQGLKSEAPRVRLLAAWAMGEVGSLAPWRSRIALIKAQRSETRDEVREMLSLALRKLGKE